MNQQQVIADIKYIKEVIDSSLRYTNLSGKAAIFSGLIALGGCVFSQRILHSWTISPDNLKEHAWPLAITWTSVVIVSAIVYLHYTWLKAKRTGQPAWSRLSRLILYAFSPPLLIGALLTLFLISHYQTTWIPGIWMITFGLGVWSAGLFSIQEPRCLGAIFMATGLATLFFLTHYSLVTMAFSFGLCHIVYGIRLYRKDGG